MSAVTHGDGLMASFAEHAGELRSRLVATLAILAAASALAYPATPAVMRMLARPLSGLYFSRPLEAFDTRLELALYLALPAALPLVLFQAWAFIRPALGEEAARLARWLLPASYLLFFTGGSVAFFAVLPPATSFFLSFAQDDVRPLISISEYVGFALRLVVSFGLAFQTPLVMLALTRLGLVTPDAMRRARRGVYFTAFVAGALFTSPEVLTQISLAVPLIVLYEIGLLLSI